MSSDDQLFRPLCLFAVFFGGDEGVEVGRSCFFWLFQETSKERYILGIQRSEVSFVRGVHT